jgi:hypothetical protein
MCRPCYRKAYPPQVKPDAKPKRLCLGCKRKPCSERKHTFINIGTGPMPAGNQLNSNSYWWIKLRKRHVGLH